MQTVQSINHQTRVANLPRRVTSSAIASVYTLLWVGGLAHHSVAGSKNPAQDWLASLALLLAGLIVIVGADAYPDLMKLIGVASLGFVIEVCGVRFTFPFGAYSYTDVLKPQLFEVPLVMAFAWMVLVAYVKQMLLHFELKFWAELALAAAWMTAIDLLIDPLAVNKLAFWQWASAGRYYGVPANNFVGWFVASLLFFSVFRGRWQPNKCALFIGISALVFFTLVALAHELFLAAVLGCGLCFFHVVVRIQLNGRQPRLVSRWRKSLFRLSPRRD